jgi:hypothetical protein
MCVRQGVNHKPEENSDQIPPIALEKTSSNNSDNNNRCQLPAQTYMGRDSGINPRLEEVLLKDIMRKAMLDGQGNNKGYFTKDDFVYTAIMEPNWHCTEDQAEQTFLCSIEEGKLIEIEPGKYKPTSQTV